MALVPADSRTSGRDSFGDRVLRVATNIVVLRVTTIIGEITPADADDLHRVTGVKLGSDNRHVASLSINTALGDSTLLMSPGFVDNPTYLALHEEAVKKAEQVRADSVRLLREIYQEFKDKLGF